jgi:response regulator RpfG family c-di-GMP phosphodiesterase
MNIRSVLFVDDDPTLLDTYRRLLGRQFNIRTEESPAAGLVAVQQAGPFAVVVSDLRMPGMSGVEFLALVRAAAPDTVRVMLTGFADTSAAVAAVNQGQIFRFLNKPCPSGDIAATLEACVDQYALVVAERDLLEKTLAGSVRMVMEILGLMNPGALGRATRVRKTMRELGKVLQIANAWQVELAGMLSQIGCLSISPDLLDRVWAGQILTMEEATLYASHPLAGSQLLAHIPRLEPVARIIAQQLRTEAPKPGWTEVEMNIRRAAQMLQVAVKLDQLTSRGLRVPEAIAEMKRPPCLHPADLLAALETFARDEAVGVEMSVMVSQLEPGMSFAEDVKGCNGELLVPKGREANMPVIVRLRSYDTSIGVDQPFRVLVPAESAAERVA